MPAPEPRASLLALEQTGIKLGLDQIRALVERLGRPDRAFPSIIVAGTNGKGSVTAMIERGLRAAGWHTGRFTSPHLVELEERFAIDGRSISPAVLDEAAARVLSAGTSLPAPPTFFEATTALALDVFRDARINVAVLEVGLGGRLDATNVVDAQAAVITSVDFDHEQYLGHTIEAIAAEKAGVIKPGAAVVLAANPAAVDEVVRSVSVAAGARLIRAHDGVIVDVEMKDGRAHVALETPVRRYGRMRVALRGRHQVENAITAVRLLEVWSERGLDVPQHAIASAVEDAEWPARLETIRVESIEVLLDGAHNPAGARSLAQFVLETHGRRLPMVIGMMRDKAVDAVLASLAPAASRFVFTAPSSARAASPMELSESVTRLGLDVLAIAEPDPVRAVRLAGHHESPVVVAGSLYLAGEIRARRS